MVVRFEKEIIKINLKNETDYVYSEENSIRVSHLPYSKFQIYLVS